MSFIRQSVGTLPEPYSFRGGPDHSTPIQDFPLLSSSSLPNQDDDRCIFEVGLDDVSTMNRVLHEIHHTDDHSVLVVDKDGLRLITNGEKTFQISIYFAASTFHKFQFDSDRNDHVNFRFIMKEFVECLNLLRDDIIDDKDKVINIDEVSRGGDTMKTSLEIKYRRRGDPLRLKLENNSNCVINCELKAFNLPGDSAFSPITLNEGEDTAVVVFNSRKLFDYISGIDLSTCELVSLKLTHSSIPIKISTKSTLIGEVELELSEDESEIIKRELRLPLGCDLSFKYRAQFMKPALDALKTSTFMKLRCGTSGLLCLEHFHGVREVNKSDAPFFRTPDGFPGSSENSVEFMTDINQPQRKRSSVEYFILSEVTPSDSNEALD